jgi:hypothetical protein
MPRAMKRENGKWTTEHPENLSAWLWRNDGLEAVVIDGSNYYCAHPDAADKFREAWAKEGRKNDKRVALSFGDLDRQLYAKEVIELADEVL